MSKRPHAPLIALVREADRMWESLHLREKLGRLAAELAHCAIESPMGILEKNCGEAGVEDKGLRQRLRDLLREPAKATARDLEMLMPLLSKQDRDQLEPILRDDPRKNARTDEVRTALARLCAKQLREQNAQHMARQRMLSPAFDFFLKLSDIELMRIAGFVSESEIQEVMAHRRVKAAQSVRARQARCRSRKKARTQA